MRPLMNLHLTRLRESLFTLGTDMRFLSIVDSHVIFQLCVVWCIFKWLDWEKHLPQEMQEKGCSPVCIRWCALKFEDV